MHLLRALADLEDLEAHPALHAVALAYVEDRHPGVHIYRDDRAVVRHLDPRGVPQHVLLQLVTLPHQTGLQAVPLLPSLLEGLLVLQVARLGVA